ncbi:MAG: TetR family transcriptional regulator [Sphingopyxis macrogoltabida]|uniref:TetR family transcriptional regulator n=1 Tax=Sphingopyxis macrogoltabida TaxID=33050 RepID=A0A2W5N7L1_SPHMC|nr:MAG: TetR family transcriptional regulator [Sphingopyxis macrogoltabida]
MARTASTRKRDAVATRAAILASARQRFLRESYDSVGLRDIAGDAGVDVALISRYFGGKEGLFGEVVSKDKEPSIFQEPKSLDEFPDFLARMVLEDDEVDRVQRMEMFVIILRSAASPKAGEIIQDMVRNDVLEPMTRLMGPGGEPMKADMLLAILMGITVMRTVMNTEIVPEQDRIDQCRAYFRNIFKAALAD